MAEPVARPGGQPDVGVHRCHISAGCRRGIEKMRSRAGVNHGTLHEHDVRLLVVPVITIPAEFLIAGYQRVSGRRLTEMQAVVADDQSQVARDGSAIVFVLPSVFIRDGRMMPLAVNPQAHISERVDRCDPHMHLFTVPALPKR